MTLAKPIALYMKLVAAAVVVHFFVYPFYGPGETPDDPANLDGWLVLDWFMAAAIVLLVLTTWHRRRRSGAGQRNAQTMFIASVAMAIAFFPNWFAAQWAHGDDFTIWHLIDTFLPILLWLEGHRLWKLS